MILVTGGTGLIGSHLLFHLTKNGKQVKASYRNKHSIDKVSRIFGFYVDNPESLLSQISWVKADITDVASLDRLFEDVDEVYHCAALISFDPKHLDALIKTNTEGTANLVNLCLASAVKKLCYVSSIAAIGPSAKGEMATEDNEWNDSNISVYGLTKHDAELEVWRGSQEGLPVVIVNPGVVLGPGFWKSGSGTFFSYAHKGKSHFIPGGTGFVTIDDVTTAMVALMDSNIERERFILVNENLTYQEIFSGIATRLSVPVPSKKIGFWVLECVWRLDGLRSKFLGKRRRFTKNMVKGLYRQEIYSNKKIKKTLDFKFGDLNATLDFCCAQFKSRD